MMVDLFSPQCVSGLTLVNSDDSEKILVKLASLNATDIATMHDELTEAASSAHKL